MKYFLDTNIILDFFISDRQDHGDVNFLLHELIKRDSAYEFWIDRDSISTINYILRKENFRNDVTKRIISNFSISGETSVLFEAIEYASKNGCDYEDILKILSAQKIEAAIFVTQDKELLSKNDDFSIQIMSTFDFLRKMDFQRTQNGDWINSEDVEISNLSIRSLVDEIHKINQMSSEEYTDEIRIRNRKLINKLDEYTKKLKESEKEV